MRNWLEVDLKKLENNINVVRNELPKTCEIIAVVKANAYGHGDAAISKKLESIGIKYFAVASIKEAINLREAGIKGSIIVLSYVGIEEFKEAYENDITLCAISYEYTLLVNEYAKSNNIRVKMHLKLNTGMNRIGFECKTKEDYEKLEEMYKLSNIDFTGIFSHFSSSDDLSEGADDYTRLQLDRFEKTIDYLSAKGIKLGLKHISNSGGIGKYKEARFDAVRCGALMYGYNTAIDNKLDVKPIAVWKTLISSIRILQKGDCVSYSRKYVANGNERIASVCVGYADGYKRMLSNKGYVLVNGKRCRIVGNICMDQMMIDVSNVEAKAFDEVILMSDLLDADELADLSSTCMHDIISSIGPRVERVYINGCI